MVVLNDLFDYGLKIYQDKDKFKFSLDSLLLAEFTNVKKSDKKLLDLCSGNAPLPLILASKHDIKITGIEIQKEINDLAEKSIKYNNLESKIEMLNLNALETKKYFSRNSFDIVTCNPPFFKINENSKLNEKEEKRIARHEVTITLKEIIEVASYNLKDKGSFYLVHRPDRLEEIINYASEYNLHVKEIEFIFSNNEDYAIMVLLKYIKNAKLGVKIGSKIINRETESYQNIFKRR